MTFGILLEYMFFPIIQKRTLGATSVSQKLYVHESPSLCGNFSTRPANARLQNELLIPCHRRFRCKQWLKFEQWFNAVVAICGLLFLIPILFLVLCYFPKIYQPEIPAWIVSTCLPTAMFIQLLKRQSNRVREIILNERALRVKRLITIDDIKLEDIDRVEWKPHGLLVLSLRRHHGLFKRKVIVTLKSAEFYNLDQLKCQLDELNSAEYRSSCTE